MQDDATQHRDDHAFQSSTAFEGLEFYPEHTLRFPEDLLPVVCHAHDEAHG